MNWSFIRIEFAMRMADTLALPNKPIYLASFLTS